MELLEQDYNEVRTLAKEASASRGINHSLEQQLQKITSKYWNLEDKFNKLFMSTKDFRDAMKLAPQRVKQVFSEIFLKAREERETKRKMRVNKRRDEYER